MTTIKITETAIITLPIYLKRGDDYMAILGLVEGRNDRYVEVHARTSGISIWQHMDAAGVVKEVMDREEVTEAQFKEAYDVALGRIRYAVEPITPEP